MLKRVVETALARATSGVRDIRGHPVIARRRFLVIFFSLKSRRNGHSSLDVDVARIWRRERERDRDRIYLP